MASLFEIRHIRCLALPQIPVQCARWLTTLEWSARQVFTQDDVDSLKIADPSLSHEFRCQAEAMVAALPRSHLNDAPSFPSDIAQPLAFIDC